MSDDAHYRRRQQLVLFVCSGCELCDAAAAFLQGWSSDRSEVALRITSVFQAPDEIVRLGITYTPALVMGEKILGQHLSVNALVDLLQSRAGTAA